MFDEFFEAILADDEESRDAHHRLRYEVYCRETGFESASEFPDGRERDEFDGSAAAFLVRSRVSGDLIATMRLVVGQIGQLPISQFLDPEERNATVTAGEISRFCVSSRYRRRTSQEVRVPRSFPSPESRVPSPDPGSVGSLLESRDPWILIGLLRAVRQYTDERSISRCHFLAAASMAAGVRAAGFSISEAGPEVEHRGWRRAYRFHWNAAEAGLEKRSPVVARMFGRRPAYRLASRCEMLPGDPLASAAAQGTQPGSEAAS
ncbi:MAG TPA: PEP-CTERM/exosortase system-associated acyltransferase [Thermoanaerobaculia bacterium]|jgi:N-acyl amino acid synthase of PEP-CTERM/exosortase system|nr:PEP-CTERM/exosortase system-associated acyltransferase [Thermoanaerobaculia bacterium]